MKKQIENFFVKLCDNPQRALLFYIACSVVCWTLQCTLLQNILGLDIIEALTWGNFKDPRSLPWDSDFWGSLLCLDWGHAKHPPLSGWVAFLFSKLSFGHDWGLYLGAQLAIMGSVWFTYLLGQRLFNDRYRSATGALLLCFLHYYTPSEMRLCTYPVEMFLVSLIGWSFIASTQSRRWFYFLIFGIACGLAVLNKYTCGTLLLVLLLYSFGKKCHTIWHRFGPYLAFIAFAAVISLHIVWLFKWDFICLAHVGTRLDEKFYWYDPLLTIGATIYPFAVEALVLACCAFFSRRSLVKKKPEWPIFYLMLLFTLPPCLLFVISSFCGKSVILMWFCSLASFTGIAAVAAMPFELKKEQFRVFYIILWLFTTLVFIGATADLLFSSRERLHADPQTIVQIGQKMWHDSGRTDKIAVVLGDRWYGGVYQNYSAEKTPFIDIEDLPVLDAYWNVLKEKGALLMISDADQLKEFNQLLKPGFFSVKKVEYSYKSLLGRKRGTYFFVGFLNPTGLNSNYFPPAGEKAAELTRKLTKVYNDLLDMFQNLMRKINIRL